MIDHTVLRQEINELKTAVGALALASMRNSLSIITLYDSLAQRDASPPAVVSAKVRDEALTAFNQARDAVAKWYGDGK